MEIFKMTTTEFKIKMKEALNTADKGLPVIITRGGKVYTVQRVAEGK
jgi:hypothetical protein